MLLSLAYHEAKIWVLKALLKGEFAFALNGGASIQAPIFRSELVSVGVKIFQTEGVGALFSGISVTVLRQTLYSTTRMGLYEIFREKWTDWTTGEMD
ncbi:hypothetical protein CTI12_AA366450 [Artemisia annua]|uniref:Uncharacterized protein n=1 Tax=Artemisia annua TaxID=35608 RepID=A0A2U1L6I6_ARTAN|nr:hypothetical protein CTI12_AA366450 [Artemisia annua]